MVLGSFEVQAKVQRNFSGQISNTNARYSVACEPVVGKRDCLDTNRVSSRRLIRHLSEAPTADAVGILQVRQSRAPLAYAVVGIGHDLSHFSSIQPSQKLTRPRRGYFFPFPYKTCPGLEPTWRPFSTTSVPLTKTYSIPSGY